MHSNQPGPLPLRGTVLLVEDDPLVRKVVQRILERDRLHVIAVGSMAEALDMLSRRDEPLDLLLSDVVMAQGSGPELWRSMRALRPEVRVLFMSGHPRDALAAIYPEIATEDFLPKPFTAARLGAAVNAHFARRVA